MDVAKETAVSTATLIYFAIGCFSLALALISFLFAEIGDFFHDITSFVGDWIGDHFSFGHDHDIGISRFLNNGGILGFLAGFGFIAALAMAQFRASVLTAAIFGVLGGFTFGVIMGAIWYLLKRSEGTVGYKAEDLVGQTAVVTEKIFSGGLGKVKCDAFGRPVWHIAKAEDGKEILPGTAVKVIKVVGSLLYVVPEESN